MVFTTTFDDDLSTLTMRPGMAICIDECPISDRDAIQYCSAGILKVVFDPSSPGGIRARGHNAQFAANTARLLSSNALSLQDWGGTRVKFTAPLQRKLICFQITLPLVPRMWSSLPDYIVGEE